MTDQVAIHAAALELYGALNMCPCRCERVPYTHEVLHECRRCRALEQWRRATGVPMTLNVQPARQVHA